MREPQPHPLAFDLLIRGGRVIDPAQGIDRSADVAVRDSLFLLCDFVSSWLKILCGGGRRVDSLDELNAPRVINASGRMTALGVNTLSEGVLEAMATAGRGYVDIAQLQRRTGQRIAEMIGAEDAMITTGAAAGVTRF